MATWAHTLRVNVVWSCRTLRMIPYKAQCAKQCLSLVAWMRGWGNLFPWRTASATTNHNLTNSVRGDSNTHVGNVSNSYNDTTINVGVGEGSLRIQAWLSPLEPHRRHQDVRNRRLDGVGDWVLRRNEFESWCGGLDGSVDP
ncbi:hypothetical protein C7212DRAFT_344572 [Tuber magnatum]|uniref:Uncharacterized protein n=1 Tax=Tuber magnatum TaxID=42249 RepID=A0A317SNP0_9PEZI|nr:hypothetical protein C7212DRAFT_344572 [Tuber magnatum]